ncbi:hypothetical protein A6S26_10765 [Nostoc sp. ATCC 43529]|nr:hypothetical protein A6S26_10765 [Nostoc sp. ATCC 43529]
MLDSTGYAKNGDKVIFNDKEFIATIQGYCNQLGWKISDIDDDHAILQFDMESGSVQTLFIYQHRSILELFCPSLIRFPVEKYSQNFHWISTFLLKENTKYTLGFWCIQEIAGCYIFSIMHNAEISLIDINYFAKVIAWLVEECEQFEQAIQSMLNSHD